MACDLYQKEDQPGPPAPDIFAEGNAFMPPRVARWLGLDGNPLLQTGRTHHRLMINAATVNDDGATFAEIADYIESTYLSKNSSDMQRGNSLTS